MSVVKICLVNQKGGCGKSSTCFHLAGVFAEQGMRVLLIDADPQGSLSQGFFGPTAIESLAPDETLAALFDEEQFVCLETLATPTVYPGITVVRANQSLAPHNAPCPETSGLKQQSLRDALDEVQEFDLVLMDCPPNLYQCSWNALVAADFVLVPVPPEDFGTQGLRVVQQAIDNARRLNPGLQLLGHLVTRYDGRLLVHQSYTQRLRTLYGELVLRTVIPEATAFKVALACRKPVTLYAPTSKAARATQLLAEEILFRISHQNQTQRVA
jgi:chromosome partitioning protein